MAAAPPISNLYRTIWRWHFYAGLCVLPVVILLAISGTLYLFKPQIERWEERGFQGQPTVAAVAPHRQVDAALAAHPSARFLDYRLPERTGDAALVRIALPDGGGAREVFVAPEGAVLGTLVPEQRLMAVVKRVHSELLVGPVGNRLVELAASWAILLLLSGLYLWWPRGRGLAGVLWPRLTRGSRTFWRDLHAVTGVWISGLALVLLLTGLPWTEVWGNGFKTVRMEMGWVKGDAPWAIDGDAPPPAADPHAGHRNHDGHDPASPPSSGDGSFDPATFDRMVARARTERLAFPAIVTPPGAPGRFGMAGQMAWTIRSDAANVPLQRAIRIDLAGQRDLSHERFADSHVIDRVVGYGIAWHQGQLFGPLNQLIGVITALGLVTLAVSGFVMWRRRKPAAGLGAPPPDTRPRAGRAAVAVLIALALFLPLLALSLASILLIERLALPRLPRLSAWLGAS